MRKAFRYYHEKGVSVCDEWSSYEAFEAWALANGYSDGLEIDRKDNDLGYSPDNCRWATRVQQMANRKKSARVNASSKYKGVRRSPRKSGQDSWMVTMSINGKPTYLGTFKTEEEAAKVYDANALKMYGDFASLNFEDSRKEN